MQNHEGRTEGMTLGKSKEDYLEAVLMIAEEKGPGRAVHSIDIARQLHFSKASVSHAVKTLREQGFLLMDDDGSLHLTETGTAVARNVYERHRFLTKHLVSLGVAPEQAEHDACEMEHVISEETFEKLKAEYQCEL
jgi:Mn-dependent DtxR family transcriptional regulator